MGVEDFGRRESVSLGLTTNDAVRAKMAELEKCRSSNHTLPFMRPDAMHSARFAFTHPMPLP